MLLYLTVVSPRLEYKHGNEHLKPAKKIQQILENIVVNITLILLYHDPKKFKIKLAATMRAFDIHMTRKFRTKRGRIARYSKF